MDKGFFHRYSASAAELAVRRRREFEAGEVVADEEIRALTDLAEAIGTAVADWRDRTALLSLSEPLDARRAGALVLETVFDDVLAPDAWRFLADALALVEPDPPVHPDNADFGRR